MDGWYYFNDKTKSPAGPVSRGDLVKLIESNDLLPAHNVCREGMDKWITVEQAKPQLGLEPAAEPVGKSEKFGWTPAATILASNLFTLIVAIVEQWPVFTALAVYWAQSVIIGLLHARRISSLRRFTTGMFPDGRPCPTTPKEIKEARHRFLFIYGAWHGMAALFLLLGGLVFTPDWKWMLISTAAFAASEFVNHRRQVVKDQKRILHLNNMLAMPLARILPIHLCMGVAFGVGEGDTTNTTALVFFMTVKTIADLLGAWGETYVYKRLHEKQWVKLPERAEGEES